MIRLIEVDEGNWRINLKVPPEQKQYVADMTTLLARAYAYRNSRSQAHFLFDGETPVGMTLYHDCDDLDAYIFSELFIDEKYQGRGCGKEAVRLVLDKMKQDGKYQKVILCYIEGNKAARKLYESFGFTIIDRDEDEIIMEALL